jgi:hypothetical protein
MFQADGGVAGSDLFITTTTQASRAREMKRLITPTMVMDMRRESKLAGTFMKKGVRALKTTPQVDSAAAMSATMCSRSI